MYHDWLELPMFQIEDPEFWATRKLRAPFLSLFWVYLYSYSQPYIRQETDHLMPTPLMIKKTFLPSKRPSLLKSQYKPVSKFVPCRPCEQSWWFSRSRPRFATAIAKKWRTLWRLHFRKNNWNAGWGASFKKLAPLLNPQFIPEIEIFWWKTSEQKLIEDQRNDSLQMSI